MSNVTLIQPSMSAGELSQEMLGRVDLQQYQLGLALSRNFFVDYHGGISNRPGTYHLDVVSEAVRLIPFERSDSEVFLIELGNKTLKIRDVNAGGEYVKNGGNPIEIATPYTIAELPFVRFIQSVDVMTLFHQNHPPRQVKHLARNNWSSNDMAFKSGPYDDINIKSGHTMYVDGQGSYNAKGATATLVSSVNYFEPNMVGSMLYLETTGRDYTRSWIQRMTVSSGEYVFYAGNYYQLATAANNALTGDNPPVHLSGIRWDGPGKDMPNDNDNHPIGVAWRYAHSGYGEVRITRFISPTKVEVRLLSELPAELFHGKGGAQTPGSATAQSWHLTADHFHNDANGEQSILLPAPQLRSEYGAEYTARFHYWGTDQKSDVHDATTHSEHVRTMDPGEYHFDFRGGKYYFVLNQRRMDIPPRPNFTEYIDLTWNGRGAVGASGTTIATDATDIWSISAFVHHLYPKCGAYYSDRLNLASTVSKPQTIWSSKTDAYDDFGTSKPLLAEDSLTINARGVKLNDIEHLLPLNALLAFTSGGIWAVSPAEAKRLSAEDPPAINIQSYNGASYLPPALVGTECLYIEKGRHSVKELQYDFNQSSFVDIDLCVRSSHLFKNRKIVSWAFAKNPHRLCWVVFDDGKAATLTYLKEQKVWGWTSHETDGRYLSVCVADAERSEVFFVVERKKSSGAYYSVERMAPRIYQDIEAEMHFVDNGVYINRERDTSITLAELQNNEFSIQPHAAGEFSSVKVGDSVLIRHKSAVYSLTVIEVQSGQPIKCRANQVMPGELLTPNIVNGRWGMGVKVIDNLDHLERQWITTVVDGMVGDTHIVKNGRITLTMPALHVHVGLFYKATGKTLPLELAAQGMPTTQTKPKSVSKVSVKMLESSGVLAGTSLDKLYEMKIRDDESYREPARLLTGIGEVDVSSNFNKEAQFYFVQDKPLPFTVLSIFPEVEFGG